MTFYFEYRRYSRGDFSNAHNFPEVSPFVIRSMRHRNLCNTPPRSCTVHNAIPYMPSTVFPASVSPPGCSRYLQHAWLAYMRASDFETLTMGKAPLNGRRRAGQSLDYSVADFSRCFSPAAVTAIVLFPTRRCNFSGVNRTM